MEIKINSYYKHKIYNFYVKVIKAYQNATGITWIIVKSSTPYEGFWNEKECFFYRKYSKHHNCYAINEFKLVFKKVSKIEIALKVPCLLR